MKNLKNKVNTHKYTILLVVILLGVAPFVYSYASMMTKEYKKMKREESMRYYTSVPESREDFSITFKEFIMPLIKEHRDTMFPNMEDRDIAIILNILAITETSAQLEDGNWYVMQSPLANNNSLFGVKARKGGLRGSHNTWEEIDGNIEQWDNESFAYYKSYEDCFIDWLDLIYTVEVDDDLRYKNVFTAESWGEALVNLQLCGYMTDSKYPTKGVAIYNKSLKELYKLE